MIAYYYLFKTPLTPDYKKVIDSIQSVPSQSNFNTRYQSFLVANYSPSSQSVSGNKNVVVNNNGVSFPIEMKITSAREYNYITLSDDAGALTFYFIVGYYTQNENITILQLKYDAWANNYYILHNNSDYKNKIVRSHLDDNFYETIEEKINIEHDETFVKQDNTEYVVNQNGTTYGDVSKDYKLLFAKVFTSETISNNHEKVKWLIPIETIESLPVYYVPLALVDMVDQKPVYYNIRRISLPLTIDGVDIVDDNTYANPSYSITYQWQPQGEGFQFRLLDGVLATLESNGINVVKCELTYNFPLKYVHSKDEFYDHNIEIPATLCPALDFATTPYTKLFNIPLLCSCVYDLDLHATIYKYKYQDSINNIQKSFYNTTNYTDKSTFSKFLLTDAIFNNYPYNYYSINVGKDFEPFIKCTHGGKLWNNIYIEKPFVSPRLYRIYRAYSINSVDDIEYLYNYITSVGRVYSRENALSAYLNENSGSIIIGSLGSVAKTIASQNPSSIIDYTSNFMQGLYSNYMKPDKVQATGNDYINDLFLQDNLTVLNNVCRVNANMTRVLYDWYYKGHIFEKHDNVVTRVRKYFDYKQTRECSLPYIKNINDRLELERAFDSGVTIVHAINNDINISDLSLYQLINEVI